MMLTQVIDIELLEFRTENLCLVPKKRTNPVKATFSERVSMLKTDLGFLGVDVFCDRKLFEGEDLGLVELVVN